MSQAAMVAAWGTNYFFYARGGSSWMRLAGGFWSHVWDTVNRASPVMTPGSHSRVGGNVNQGRIRINRLRLLDLHTEFALASD